MVLQTTVAGRVNHSQESPLPVPTSSPRLGTYRSAQPGNGSWMHSPLSGPQVSCWALLGRRTVPPTPSPVGSCSSDGLPCRPEKDTQSQAWDPGPGRV